MRDTWRVTTEPWFDRGRRGDRAKKTPTGFVCLLVTRLAEGAGKPLKTLVQTVTGGSASGLDVLREPLVVLLSSLGASRRARSG